MTVLHVALTGSDAADGTVQNPLRTINRAAQLAQAGDTVRVHEGTYREWVDPARGGLSDSRRITYEAAPGEHVRITGAEAVAGWQLEPGAGVGAVWRVSIDNQLFGEANPFALTVEGDWVVRPVLDAPARHLGDVYLDGVSLYEVDSRAELDAPRRREQVVDDRTGREVPVVEPDRTTGVWYAEVGSDTTTVWANFGDADPRESLVEVNVRRSVFWPRRNHVDYITVRGFELCQAATPWAPPTADQPGLVGPNWARGWVIEDCDIHDAKCSAVSLGKEASTGDNFFTRRLDKPGYQYQLESVFTARHYGWSKEHIGSHVVRNNVIHDCGQNGIVGHLGCVFSRITGNHIYNVASKREFYGHEIGGIKLHAAIDVLIAHNHIEHCALGIWSDWQTQGTRFTGNVLHDNVRDLYVEVSHGPYLVDHNVFASPAAIETMSDGGAYVGNLVAGTLLVQSVLERATPYHVPHSTEVAGYAAIYAGDDRLVGNIFVGRGGDAADVADLYLDGTESHTTVGFGTLAYDDYPASWQEYADAIRASLPGDLDLFLKQKNPVYINDNVYLGGARPYVHERGAFVDAADAGVLVRVADDGLVQLSITLPAGFEAHRVPVATTASLGRPRMVDADFDNPDGSPLRLDVDLLGHTTSADATAAGPVFDLRAGANTLTVWTPSASR